MILGATVYFSTLMSDQSSNIPLCSIVLPCYNPIENWHINVVDNIRLIEKTLNGTVNLIIVNDGSTQRVSDVECDYIVDHHHQTRIIQYTDNKGKGYALRQGVAVVEHFPIIYTDIDFPYTMDSLEAIYHTLTEGHDAVLGKRDNDYYKNTPWARKWISKTLRGVLKLFLRLPTNDTQCGIKGFNQQGAQLFLSTEIDRFLFDLEFVKLLSKRKSNCTTVDVQLKPDIVFSKVNMKILLKESVNFVKVLFRK